MIKHDDKVLVCLCFCFMHILLMSVKHYRYQCYCHYQIPRVTAITGTNMCCPEYVWVSANSSSFASWIFTSLYVTNFCSIETKEHYVFVLYKQFMLEITFNLETVSSICIICSHEVVTIYATMKLLPCNTFLQLQLFC